MVFGQNCSKANGSKLPFYDLRTVQGLILGHNSLRKRIGSPKEFPSKSAKNWENAQWLAHGFWSK